MTELTIAHTSCTNEEEESNKPIPLPSILWLPTEIQTDIIRHCLPTVRIQAPFQRKFHRSDRYYFTDISRVCRKFHDITADLLSREKTLEFVVYDDDRADGLDFPVRATDKFQSLYVSIQGWERNYSRLTARLEALVAFLEPAARCSRGAPPVRGLEVFFRVWEEHEYWRWGTFDRLKGVVSPFQRLRGLSMVLMSSPVVSQESWLEQYGWGDERLLWRNIRLYYLEKKFFRKAAREMRRPRYMNRLGRIRLT